MCDIVRIGGKLLSIHEATKKLNKNGSTAIYFFEAMHIFNFEYPLEAAIMSCDCCKVSFRGSSHEIAKTEAI